MTKPLVFMMGQSPVFLPTDRKYAKNHMWAKPHQAGCRFGLTAYAVKLLGEMRSLRWTVSEGSSLEQSEPIGTVEASKAVSDLYAPLSGSSVILNAMVVADPSLIHSDPYESGWLLALATDDDSPLLNASEYRTHLEATWPLAQRMLKGQVGR